MEWSIQDVGSLTGTYLNGVKLIKHNEYKLSNNDALTLARSDYFSENIRQDKYAFFYTVVAPQTNANTRRLSKKSESSDKI